MELAEQYLGRTGRTFKIISEDALQTSCPSCWGTCEVRRKTWVWACPECKEHGNKYRMQQLHGSVYSIAKPGAAQEDKALLEMRVATAPLVVIYKNQLWERDEAEAARQYLMVERRLSESVLRHANVGWALRCPASSAASSKPHVPNVVAAPRRGSTEEAPAAQAAPPSSTGWITIPTYRARGGQWLEDELDLVKIRSVPPAEKKFLRVAGGKSSLYMPWCLLVHEPVILVGGEIDVLSCNTAGDTQAAALATGEGGWSDDVYYTLEAHERIVIALDNDEAGRRGSEILAVGLGRHRCYIATWPADCKDANDCLVKYGEREMAKILERMKAEARPCAGETVIKVKDLADEIIANLDGVKSDLSWGLGKAFDELTEGRRLGEVSTWIGDTGSGKSTVVSQVALAISQMAGDKVMFLPLELGAKRQALKWVRQSTGNSPKTMDHGQLRYALNQLGKRNLWMMNHYGGINPDMLKTTLEYGKERLGITTVFVDHLHFAVRAGDKERERLEQMMETLAQAAVELNMAVNIVAHPHGTGKSDEKNRDNRIVQMGDIKGSSSIKQISDNVFSVWRPRTEKREGIIRDGYGTTFVYALKLRDDDAVEGSVALRFAPKSATYDDMPITKEYVPSDAEQNYHESHERD